MTRCITSLGGPSLMALLAAGGCSRPAPEAPRQGATPPAAPALAARAVRPPAEAPHWDYEADGPAKWGALSPAFAACGEGHSQSPIDIRGAVKATVPELRANFRPAELRIVHHEHMADVVNTGHSVQVDYPDGDTLAIGADRYALLQFHFHSPSEHHVDGRPYAAEMHLVHKAADGRLAVVGVLIEEGATNAVFEKVRANLPSKKGEQIHLPHVTVDVDELLPRASGSYRYAGSLTTPPCSEGVTWIVMTTPITASVEQLARLRAVLVDNNRPVQPLYDRKILVERVGETSAQASR